MALEEVNKAIQTELLTLPNIEQLKVEQEECLRRFIASKDVMALLPIILFTAQTGFGMLPSVAFALHTSWTSISNRQLQQSPCLQQSTVSQ